MPLPQPYDSQAGRRSLTDEASQVWGNVTWIARWSKEILADQPTLDMKKAAQLIVHCWAVVDILDRFRDGNGDIVELREAIRSFIKDRTGTDMTAAEVNAEMKALYTGASSFSAWASANFPLTAGLKQSHAAVLDDATRRLKEVSITTTAPAALITRVQALRDLFV